MKPLRIFLAFLLLFSLTVLAQDKPNFSGKWQLDTAKSEFGQFPAPDTQTNVIDHKEPDIRLKQTIKSEAVPGGEATVDRHYTTDGKENVNEVRPQQVKSTAKWEGNKLLINTKLEIPDGTIEIKDSWELTDGGKQLLVIREFKTPQGDQQQKLLFNKQ